MELRHLRYFIAVAEEGSLTVAAKKRLHTAQPSLSRQMRDLEYQVGVPLMSRGARGAELTAAGKAFLDRARLALMQVDAAVEAARRAAQPAKPTFTRLKKAAMYIARMSGTNRQAARRRMASASTLLFCIIPQPFGGASVRSNGITSQGLLPGALSTSI